MTTEAVEIVGAGEAVVVVVEGEEDEAAVNSVVCTRDAMTQTQRHDNLGTHETTKAIGHRFHSALPHK